MAARWVEGVVKRLSRCCLEPTEKGRRGVEVKGGLRFGLSFPSNAEL